MSRTIIEHDDDCGGFAIGGLVLAVGLLVLLAYLVVWVGIPALIIYGTYRLIKWAKSRRKKRLAREVNVVSQRLDYITNRLAELDDMCRRGIISQSRNRMLSEPLVNEMTFLEMRYTELTGGVVLFEEREMVSRRDVLRIASGDE